MTNPNQGKNNLGDTRVDASDFIVITGQTTEELYQYGGKKRSQIKHIISRFSPKITAKLIFGITTNIHIKSGRFKPKIVKLKSGITASTNGYPILNNANHTPLACVIR